MPFKCINCNKIIQSMDQAECECESPFFVECATIHYIHKDGPGVVYSKILNNGGASIDDEGFSKPLTIRNEQTLNLCCSVNKLNSKREQVHATFMRSLVSCPDCLAFINKLNSRRTQECQSLEARTTDSTTDSQLEIPKSASVNPTATMEEI